jgi:amidase
MRKIIALLLAVTPLSLSAAEPVEEKSIAELSAAMAKGESTSEKIVEAYLNRIARIDDAGPKLNAVIATMPDALTVARERDAERRVGKVRGPLHGIPILIKDNIEASGPIPTTAGSLALGNNVTGRDAPLVARLKAAGAIILGKTNLSEWANIRSDHSSSGWSAVGGLTLNPYSLNRTACGSSSGSGAAIAASLAGGAIGTETDGSITCPSGVNGLAGFKPTVGLVSRHFVVPISHTQDTPGPMARTVMDAAILLSAMAGSDPADPATKAADSHRIDFAAQLNSDGLKGVRIGVMRDRLGGDPAMISLFEAALANMRLSGAVVVDIKDSKSTLGGLDDAEFSILLYELKADLGTYLAALPARVTTRTLADVIAFNKANGATEMKWFGQETFEQAQAKNGLDDPAYKSALAKAQRLAGPMGIDRLLSLHKVDLLVGITNGPAWTIDLVNGDHFSGPSAGQMPAVAGYPHLTVPMGTLFDLPIGISFIGAKWDDARVLRAGFAYEQRANARRAPLYLPSIESGVAAAR